MSETNDLHEKAFCPLTESGCKGSECAVAVRIRDYKGWIYAGGYRCGLAAPLKYNGLTVDKPTDKRRFSESHTSFDESGRLC